MEKRTTLLRNTLNNKDYYLISDYNGNTSRGWVPASEISVKTTTPNKTNATYYDINGNANIYDTPWEQLNKLKLQYLQVVNS